MAVATSLRAPASPTLHESLCPQGSTLMTMRAPLSDCSNANNALYLSDIR